MAEAKARLDWSRTSSLMALAVNLVRDPNKGTPARPDDFNPFAPKKPIPVLRGKDLEILKHVFVKEKKP